MHIRRAFEEALSGLSLDNDFLIFIDGIDVRPSGIDYKDYFECVGGLVDAIWSVNSDFLANIKDSKGRIRIVLLVRPDILLKTGLHNMNTKLKDNSVYLDWGTSYKDYRSSLLFRVADRLLSAQQTPNENAKLGDCWDYYFSFHAENVKSAAVSAEAGTNKESGVDRKNRSADFIRWCFRERTLYPASDQSNESRDFCNAAYRSLRLLQLCSTSRVKISGGRHKLRAPPIEP